MKIQDMPFTEIGVLLESKVEELVDHTELNCWRREKERLTIVFMTPENADTFPILICRDSRYGQTGATCCERKGSTAYSISSLAGFIKDLDVSKIHFQSARMNQTLNQCDSSLCGSGSDSTGHTVEMAGRATIAQNQLNKTQASASQTTVRYSAGTSRFAA